MKMLVIHEDDKRSTLHMTCESCQVATILYVSLGQFGVVTLGTLTDLEHSEVRRMFDGEAVSVNHVIEAHQFLKDYTGGIEALI